MKNLRLVRLDRASAWGEATVQQLQDFIGDVIAAIGGLRDRIQYRSVEVLGGTYGFKVATGSTKPAGVMVAQVAQVLSPSSTNTNQFAVDWEWAGDGVLIRNLAGLTTGVRYWVTLAVFYE